MTLLNKLSKKYSKLKNIDADMLEKRSKLRLKKNGKYVEKSV